MAEQTEANQNAQLTRRKTLIASGAILSMGAIGVTAISEPASALSVSATTLTAEDDGITSHDGSIDSIVVDPVIGVSWEGFNSVNDHDIEIGITFQTDGESDITPYSQVETVTGTNGEQEFDFATADLIAAGWSTSTFEAAEDNSDTVTTVTATVSVELVGDSEVSASSTADFTVTVTNHPASVSVGGEVTTTVGSDEEV